MLLADLPPDFELDHLDLALEYVQSFRTAVDGGAHRGIWTRAMAKRFERVIAFEPVPENEALINPHEDPRIRAFGWALGAVESTGEMIAGESNTGEWHLDVTGAGTVPVTTLDRVAVALDDVDFLKLDVEGHELFALIGGEEMIARCRPVILIEEKWHGQQYYGLEPNAATKLLESWGYHVAARANKDVILVC